MIAMRVAQATVHLLFDTGGSIATTIFLMNVDWLGKDICIPVASVGMYFTAESNSSKWPSILG